MAVLVALGVGALLGSGALVGLAERQPFGTQRDVALGAAKVTDRLAHGLSLNRPAERLAEALGGEEQLYDVEALIARARATTPTTTEPPQPPPVAEDPEVGEPAPPPAEPDRIPSREPAGTTEPDPDEGPPADGIITPIEGVDCVPQEPSESGSPGEGAGADGSGGGADPSDANAAPDAAAGAPSAPDDPAAAADPPDGEDGADGEDGEDGEEASAGSAEQVECPPGYVLAGPDGAPLPAAGTADPDTAGAPTPTPSGRRRRPRSMPRASPTRRTPW